MINTFIFNSYSFIGPFVKSGLRSCFCRRAHQGHSYAAASYGIANSEICNSGLRILQPHKWGKPLSSAHDYSLHGQSTLSDPNSSLDSKDT